MILISLDESGDFENKDAMPVFIAGLLYDDGGDPSDIEDERERIREYYKRVITTAKSKYCSEKGTAAKDDVKAMFTYPEALHCTNTGGAPQKTVVKYVKEIVWETLAGFISGCRYKDKVITYTPKGKEEKRERKGRYHLFVMLKGKNGMSTGNSTDKLVNDDYASNLYFHMAGRVVSRLVFHNPLYPNHMPEVRLNVATRASASFANLSSSKKREYRELSYENRGTFPESGKEDRRYFSLMNADTYRALVADEMLRCRERCIRISEFAVHPIKYEAMLENGFAYMSDSLCSYLAFQLKSPSGTFINEVNDRLNALNRDNENLVFTYDLIDSYFSEATEAMEKKDLYGALSAMYDAGLCEGDYAEFYKDRLFGLLTERILRTDNVELLEKATVRLAESVYSSNLSQEKLKYIFEALKEAAHNENLQAYTGPETDRMMFSLWEAGIAACSHIGDASSAIDCYNNCIKYFRNAGIDAVIRLNNKLIVAMEDLFSLEMAEEQALRNISLQEKEGALLDEALADGRHGVDIARGKAVSQYGRVLASKMSPEAATSFRQALGYFKKDTPDYKITQSYLLHFLIDMADNNDDKNYLVEFENEATDYFGGNEDYTERLKYVNSLSEGRGALMNKNYAYYVLFRGMYVSHRMRKKKLDTSLWDAVKASGFSISSDKASGVPTFGHPWEITYKYLRMLAFMTGDGEYGNFCENQQGKCMRYKDKTVEALMMYGDIQVKRLAGDTLAWGNAVRALVAYMKKNFIVFRKKKFPEDREERYKELSGIFTFMYR